MSDTLPESHQRQIADDRRASLQRAGIGAEYESQTLGDLPMGQRIADWLTDDGFKRLKAGKPALFQSSSPVGLKAFHVLAKSLHFNGLGCRMASLAFLVRLVETRSYERLDEYLVPPALFVSRAMVMAESGNLPFTFGQRAQIESMLLDRLASGKTVILHAATTGRARASLKGWWSDDFADLMNTEASLILADA